MLSASSSILTFDIYKNYVQKNAVSGDLIRFGRIVTLVVLGLNVRHGERLPRPSRVLWRWTTPSNATSRASRRVVSI